jgi:hypothetical protein
VLTGSSLSGSMTGLMRPATTTFQTRAS